MRKRIFLPLAFDPALNARLCASLAQNRPLLLEAGVLFPQACEDGSDLKRVQWEVAQAPDETIVLCFSEAAQASPRWVHRLRNTLGQQFEVAVIVYLQRPEVFLESLWSTLVREGAVVEAFPDFVEKSLAEEAPDYAGRLQPWEAAFDKAHITLEILEGAYTWERAFAGLLARLGVAHPGRGLVPRDPEPPSFKTLEVTRRLLEMTHRENTALYLPATRQIGRLVADFATRQGWNPAAFHGVTQEIAGRLAAKYGPSDAALARDYLDRDQLFAEPFQPAPPARFDLAELDTLEMLDLSTQVVEHLVKAPEFTDELVKMQALERRDGPEWTALEERMAGLAEENARLEGELQAIRDLKSWKFLAGMRRVRDRLLGKR